MDAIVEVATAKMVVKAEEVTVVTTVIPSLTKVSIRKVVTSTKRVLSIAGSSISAVAPDYTLIGGTA